MGNDISNVQGEGWCYKSCPGGGGGGEGECANDVLRELQIISWVCVLRLEGCGMICDCPVIYLS